METLTRSFPIHHALQSRREHLVPEQVPFGKEPTDYLFRAEFADGSWGQARFEPFHPLLLSPFALGLHYGQSVFEGLKAYRHPGGEVSIFRPDQHHARLNRSLARMAMPAVPAELLRPALRDFVRLEQDWIPAAADGALYLRPLVFASEARLGVAQEYQLLLMGCPVRSYYRRPLRVKVETQYTRAAPGGFGAAKCGGNYGGALLPTRLAQQEGFDQVLWTDAHEHRYLEESGTMNLLFVLDGTVVAPPVSDCILDGVTRDAVLQLARYEGLPVAERAVAWDELVARFERGEAVEAYGVGTAAGLTPIAHIHIEGRGFDCLIGDDTTGARLGQQLRDLLHGRQPDVFGWHEMI